MSGDAIIRAYRQLYRHGLRAIQFSKPARYTIRDRLRHAFRKGRPEDFNEEKIANTLEFLRYATIENGLEHKILKNLLLVWWNEVGGKSRPLKYLSRYQEVQCRTTAFDTFNHNIHLLNESMGMCIPTFTLRLAL